MSVDCGGDEYVVIHRHPHWKMLAGPVLTLFICTALASIAVGFVSGVDRTENIRFVIISIVAGVWLLLVMWFCVRPYLAWITTHFVVTNRRIAFRRGVMSKTSVDVPLVRVSRVWCRRRPSERIFRSGSLIIESTVYEPLELVDFPRVKAAYRLIDSQITAGEREYSHLRADRY